MVAALEDEALKMGSTHKGKNTLNGKNLLPLKGGSKFFPSKLTLIGMAGKMKVAELFPLKVFSHLKEPILLTSCNFKNVP